MITKCARCGICCNKGGPAFHVEDKPILEKGVIPLKFLFTMRKGEPVNDNLQDSIISADSDIIKIKSRKDSTACIFFDAAENRCRIYQNRPLECKVLKCWDIREIKEVYSKNRITRKDLLSEVEPLWDLVETHHRFCSYDKIRSLSDDINAGDKNAIEQINEIIGYDTHIRGLVAEKGGVEPEITDFLFGRPLLKTIGMLGIKIKEQ